MSRGEDDLEIIEEAPELYRESSEDIAKSQSDKSEATSVQRSYKENLGYNPPFIDKYTEPRQVDTKYKGIPPAHDASNEELARPNIPLSTGAILNTSVRPEVRSWYHEMGIQSERGVPSWLQNALISFNEGRLNHSASQALYHYVASLFIGTLETIRNNKAQSEWIKSMGEHLLFAKDLGDNWSIESGIESDSNEILSAEQKMNRITGILQPPVEEGEYGEPRPSYPEYLVNPNDSDSPFHVNEFKKAYLLKMEDIKTAYNERWRKESYQKNTSKKFKGGVSRFTSEMLGDMFSILLDPVTLGVTAVAGTVGVASIPLVGAGLLALGVSEGVATIVGVLTAHGIVGSAFELSRREITETFSASLEDREPDHHILSTSAIGFAFGAGGSGLLMGLGAGARAILNSDLANFARNWRRPSHKMDETSRAGEINKEVEKITTDIVKKVKKENPNASNEVISSLAIEEIEQAMSEGAYSETIGKINKTVKDNGDLMADTKAFTRIHDALINALNDNFGTSHPRGLRFDSIDSIEQRIKNNPDLSRERIFSDQLKESAIKQYTQVERYDTYLQRNEDEVSSRLRNPRATSGEPVLTPSSELQKLITDAEESAIATNRKIAEAEDFVYLESEEHLAQERLVINLKEDLNKNISRQIFKEDLDAELSKIRLNIAEHKKIQLETNKELRQLKKTKQYVKPFHEKQFIEDGDSEFNAQTYRSIVLSIRQVNNKKDIEALNNKLKTLLEVRETRQSIKVPQREIKEQEAILKRLAKEDERRSRQEKVRRIKEATSARKVQEQALKDMKNLEVAETKNLMKKLEQERAKQLSDATTLKTEDTYTVETPQEFSVARFVEARYPEEWQEFINIAPKELEKLYIEGSKEITKKFKELAIKHPNDAFDRVVQLESYKDQNMHALMRDLTLDFETGDKLAQYLSNDNIIEIGKAYDTHLRGASTKGLSTDSLNFISGLKRTFNRVLATKRSLGEPVRELQSYAPLNISGEKVTTEGKDKFISDMQKYLDWNIVESVTRKRALDNPTDFDKLRELGVELKDLKSEKGQLAFLELMWEGVLDNSVPYGRASAKQTGYQYSKTLYFKDGSSYLDALLTYGHGESVLDAVTSQIYSEARTIALSQTFGGEGVSVIDEMKKAILGADTSQGKKKFLSVPARLERVYQEMTTPIGMLEKPLYFRMFESLRKMNTSMMTVNAWRYASTEEIFRMTAVAKEQGHIDSGEQLQNFIRYFGGLSEMTRPEKELLLGNIKRTRNVDSLGLTSPLEGAGDKASEMIYKYTGVDSITLKNKEMISLTWQNSMARKRKTPWDQLEEKQRTWFKRAGIAEDLWADFMAIADEGIAILDNVEYFSPLLLRDKGYTALADDLLKAQVSFQKDAVIEASHIVSTAVFGAGGSDGSMLRLLSNSFKSITGSPLNLFYQFYKVDMWSRLLAYTPYSIMSGLTLKELESLLQGTTLRFDDATDISYHLMDAYVRGGGGGLVGDTLWALSSPFLFEPENALSKGVNRSESTLLGAGVIQTGTQALEVGKTISDIYRTGNTEIISRLNKIFPILNFLPSKLAINRLILDHLHRGLSQHPSAWTTREQEKVENDRKIPLTRYSVPQN